MGMDIRFLASINAFAFTALLAVGPLSAKDAGDNVSFRPDGTTNIQNLDVPIPPAVSEQAAAMIKARNSAPDPTRGFTAPAEEIRAMLRSSHESMRTELLKRYPATVETKTIAGVTVRLVTPAKRAPGREKDLLINLHGGAFMLFQGSILEALPIAALTGVSVLAVDYRLAPENPFPAAVDDTVAVYRELLQTYSPDHMAIYGSSSGSILTVQAIVRARQLGMPFPAAIGFFSGTGDFARPGDSEAVFGVKGFAKHVTSVAAQAAGYLANRSLTDPAISPIYSDLKGFPPTLCMTGTRDFFLSGTSNFHRALLRAGVLAELVVFDAMPHVHWLDPTLPESEEALKIQADFLVSHLKN